VTPSRFASTDELTQAEAAAAKIHSYPRPSLLEEPLEGLDGLNIATWSTCRTRTATENSSTQPSSPSASRQQLP
jgi:hypothetical protein